MNFSTLFRLEENLQLDKKTLVILRYIAIFGQLFAINVVYNYLNLDFPIIESHIIIFIGLLTNLHLQFKIKSNQLKDLYASLFLIYDLIQLSALLYLTGGILNSFDNTCDCILNIFKYGYNNCAWNFYISFIILNFLFLSSTTRHARKYINFSNFV